MDSAFTATLGLATPAQPPAAMPLLRMPVSPTPAPAPLKLNFRAFARYYVQRRLIESFTQAPGGDDFMKDLLVGIRHVRSLYADYLRRLGEVEIEASGALALLTPAARAALKPKQVNELQDLVQSEAGIYNRDLKNTLRLLADAMSHASETLDVMDNKLDARIAQYCQPLES